MGNLKRSSWRPGVPVFELHSRDEAALVTRYPGVPMIALSGTAPPALQLRIRHFLKLEKPLRRLER